MMLLMVIQQFFSEARVSTWKHPWQSTPVQICIKLSLIASESTVLFAVSHRCSFFAAAFAHCLTIFSTFAIISDHNSCFSKLFTPLILVGHLSNFAASSLLSALSCSEVRLFAAAVVCTVDTAPSALLISAVHSAPSDNWWGCNPTASSVASSSRPLVRMSTISFSEDSLVRNRRAAWGHFELLLFNNKERGKDSQQWATTVFTRCNRCCRSYSPCYRCWPHVSLPDGQGMTGCWMSHCPVNALQLLQNEGQFCRCSLHCVARRNRKAVRE